jgi:hypothetical protein
MNKRFYMGLAAATVAMSLASSNQVFATQTDVVLNLEGNPTCSSLAINSILEIKDTAPPLVGAKIVTGPDGQKITYTVGVNGTTITTWQITSPPTSSSLLKPVNLAILKAQGSAGSRVFHFGSAGVTSDDTEQAAGRLAQVSFCYGLSGSTGTPPPLARCSELAGALDGTGIICPAVNEARVLISLDPESPHWNVKMCTCNATFNKCDPNVVVDPNATVQPPGACPNFAGTLSTVPIHIEGVQDPASLVCSTIGGQRLCFTKIP